MSRVPARARIRGEISAPSVTHCPQVVNNLELYQSYFYNFIEYLQVSSYSLSVMNVYCPGARTFLMFGRISVALVFSGMVKR